MTRTGKIARLPREVREQLNRRLQDGEPGVQLVALLNSLDETRSVLQAEFGGRAINEQNLSEWKNGGFIEWQAQQELLGGAQTLAECAGEITAAAPLLTDHLAAVLAARFAGAVLAWKNNPTPEMLQRVRSLRALCAGLVALRRGDHYAARLRLGGERLAFDQKRAEDRMTERVLQFCRDPQFNREIVTIPIEREKVIHSIDRIIFGDPPGDDTLFQRPKIAPADSATPLSDQVESNQIKPNQTS